MQEKTATDYVDLETILVALEQDAIDYLFQH